MRILIGIDDTDNLESRGTGYMARQLGAMLSEGGLALVEGITRHQLLLDPQIPYTSHNSSACLLVRANQDKLDELAHHCRKLLLQKSAVGSDAGLCIACWSEVGPVVQEFGQLAKTKVLTREVAVGTARRANILLEGLTGNGGGVIGALAAVGLRAGGNDGRFIWLKGIRELAGIYTVQELYQITGIEEIRSLDGAYVPFTARIDVGTWLRPILQGGRAVLLVEEVKDNETCEWRVAPKELIKRYSS